MLVNKFKNKIVSVCVLICMFLHMFCFSEFVFAKANKDILSGIKSNIHLSPAVNIGQEMFASSYAQGLKAEEFLDAATLEQYELTQSIRENAPSMPSNGIIGIRKVQVKKDYFPQDRHILSNQTTKYAGSLINVLGYSVPHILAYISGNNLEFNKVRAGEAAAVFMTNGIHDFLKQYPNLKGIVACGEDERYGVSASLLAGKIFGKGAEIIEFGIDALEGSSNIKRKSKGALLSVIGFGPKGSFLGLPDSLYFQKVVIGTNAKKVDIDLDAGAEKTLHTIARAYDIDVSQVKIGILGRQRHEAFLRSMIESGLRVNDPLEVIQKKAKKDGLYTSGNLTLIDAGELDLLAGLLNGKLHAVIGTGRPSEGEIMLHFARMFGWQMSGRLSSYESLRDGYFRGKAGEAHYNFSPREIGILRKNNFVQPGTEHGKQVPWDKIWIESDGSNRISFIMAYISSCTWEDDLKGVSIDQKTGDARVNFLYAGPGKQAKLIRIDYMTEISELEEAINNTTDVNKRRSLLIQLAKVYASFGQLSKALMANADALFIKKDNKAIAQRSIILAYKTLIDGRGYKDVLDKMFLKTSALDIGEDLKQDKTQLLDKVRNMILIKVGDVRIIENAIGELEYAIGFWKEDGKAFTLLRRLHHTMGDIFRVRGYQSNNLKSYLKSKEHYQKASDYFFGEIKETQKLENKLLKLQLKEMELVSELFSIKNPRQEHFHEIGQIYLKIAQIYKINGHNFRAIMYFRRAINAFERVKDFGGIAPLQLQMFIARAYEDAGVYDLAKKHYLNIVDTEKAWAIYAPVDLLDNMGTRESFLQGIISSMSFDSASKGAIRTHLLYDNIPQYKIDEIMYKCEEAFKNNTLIFDNNAFFIKDKLNTIILLDMGDFSMFSRTFFQEVNIEQFI